MTPGAGRTIRRVLGVVAMSGVCLCATACGLDGLAFRQDHRLAMVSPHDFVTVRLPLTVRWRFSDALGTPGGAATYGVFVDQAPIGPGDSISNLDHQQRLDLTVTRQTSLAVSGIDSSGGSTVEHDVTVVLLDASGHRLGETAAHVAFYLAT